MIKRWHTLTAFLPASCTTITLESTAAAIDCNKMCFCRVLVVPVPPVAWRETQASVRTAIHSPRSTTTAVKGSAAFKSSTSVARRRNALPRRLHARTWESIVLADLKWVCQAPPALPDNILEHANTKICWRMLYGTMRSMSASLLFMCARFRKLTQFRNSAESRVTMACFSGLAFCHPMCIDSCG